MTRQERQALLAQVVIGGIEKDGAVQVEKSHLDEIGLGRSTEAYANWLRDNGLRMLSSRGAWQTFVKAA